MSCEIPVARMQTYIDADRPRSIMELAREASEHLVAALHFRQTHGADLAEGAMRAAMVTTLRLATASAATHTTFQHKARWLSLLLNDMDPHRRGRVVLVAEAALGREVQTRASQGLLPAWWVADLPPLVDLWRHVRPVAATRPAPRRHDYDMATTDRYRGASVLGSGPIAVAEAASTVLRDMLDLARNGTPLRGTGVVLTELALQLACDAAFSAADAARTGRLFELLVPGKRRSPLLDAGMEAWCREEANRWGGAVAGTG